VGSSADRDASTLRVLVVEDDSLLLSHEPAFLSESPVDQETVWMPLRTRYRGHLLDPTYWLFI
jgi:hypothetical protein